MSDLEKRLGHLSPEERRLLARRLQKKGGSNADIDRIAISLLQLAIPSATTLLLSALGHVLLEAGPKQAEVLRRCAIPRWFDADVLAVLRERADGNEHVLDMLQDYSFVRQLDDRRYTYHDEVRASLLAEWREQRADELRAIQLRLADSFTSRATAIRPPGAASPTDALPMKYREYVHEALYHGLIADPQSGLSRLEAALAEAEAAHDLADLEALIEVAGDVALDGESELPLDTFVDRLEHIRLSSAASSADSPRAPTSETAILTSAEPPSSPASRPLSEPHQPARYVSVDGYDLFRRAIIEGDELARAEGITRYRALFVYWSNRCAVSAAISERSEDIADRALARASAALTPERFAQFSSLAALLAYLRSCVIATVLDYVRSQNSREDVNQHLESGVTPAPKHNVNAQPDHAELWRIISRAPMTEQERTVLNESFLMDLSPREILARHPDLFASVSDVYSAKRNLLNRLQRNPDLRRLHEETRWF